MNPAFRSLQPLLSISLGLCAVIGWTIPPGFASEPARTAARADTAASANTVAPPQPQKKIEGLYSLRTQTGYQLYVEVSPSGSVHKKYPKPEAKLGELRQSEDGKWIFAVVPEIASPDSHFPLIANVIDPMKAPRADLELLSQGIQSGSKLRFEVSVQEEGALKLDEKTGGLPYSWDTLELVPVPDATRKEIRNFEASLLGQWVFAGVTEFFGTDAAEASKDPDSDSPCQRVIEFCENGECIIDGERGHYALLDGMLKRLSIQDSKDPASYSSEKEYRVARNENEELCIRTIPVSEMAKTPGVPHFKEYLFKRKNAPLEIP